MSDDDLNNVLDRLLKAAQVDRARRDRVPVGSYRCTQCGEVHQWEGQGCPSADTMSPDEIELRANLRGMLQSAYESIPSGLDWCRVSNERWREKCAVEGKKFVANWTKEAGSAILWGPTGVGKTIAAVALMHRILDAARDRPPERVTLKQLRWAAGVAFVSCPALAISRLHHELGDEAPMVSLAMRATLLVLDEVGFEYCNPDKDTTLFEVLDHRYLQKKPTIVTSELSPGQLKARYRAATFRRIEDIGTTTEFHPTRKR